MQATKSQPNAARGTVLHKPAPCPTAEQTAKEHQAADARCGREWECQCAACRQVRAKNTNAARAEVQHTQDKYLVFSFDKAGDPRDAYFCSQRYARGHIDKLVKGGASVIPQAVVLAAPELLEALELAAEYFESPPFVALHGLTPFDKARRAIRKARGI